jgi:hypothetical protein
MRTVQSIYDDQGTFCEDELEHLIDEFATRYPDNPLLITTVRKMLEVREDARPDFINIKNAIPPYEEVCSFFDAMKQDSGYEEDLTDPHLMHGGDHHGQQQQGHQDYSHNNQSINNQGYHGQQQQGHQDYSHHSQQNMHSDPQAMHHGQDQHHSGAQSQYVGPSRHQQPQQQQQQHYGQESYSHQPQQSQPQQVHHQQSHHQDVHQSQPQNVQTYSHHQGSHSYTGGQQSHTQTHPQHSSNVVSRPPPPQSHSTPAGIIDTGKTKVIDGRTYKEISETKTETNDQGQQVRRIYIKYELVEGHNDAKSQVQVSGKRSENSVSTRPSEGGHQVVRRESGSSHGQQGQHGGDYYGSGTRVYQDSRYDPSGEHGGQQGE